MAAPSNEVPSVARHRQARQNPQKKKSQASNTPQLKAIADNVEAEAKKNCNELAFKHEGRKAQQWILIDYINIVVHVMLPEPRKFYQLEEMWSDAPMIQHD